MKTYPEQIAEGIKRTVFQEDLAESVTGDRDLDKIFKKVAKGFDAVVKGKEEKMFGDGDVPQWSQIFKRGRVSDLERNDIIDYFIDEIRGEYDFLDHLKDAGSRSAKVIMDKDILDYSTDEVTDFFTDDSGYYD